MNTEAEKFTINLHKGALQVCRDVAMEQGIEVSAFVARLIHEYAIGTGRMKEEEASILKAQFEVIDAFVELSKELYQKGQFTDHFVLTVFKAAMERPALRSLYERAIDGDAFAKKLPGKTPLNMYLGWYIKNAIGAHPQKNGNGKPLRVQVRNAPIQSYTLLEM